MKKIGLLFSFLLVSIFCTAQIETNNWIMGYGSWFEMNTQSINYSWSSANFNAVEKRSVTVSDSCGQLLFFSDNDVVLDKNFEIMPNGVLPNDNPNTFVPYSSFVIPKPNTPNIYYFFRYELFDIESFTWREIDMTLNGGLGDVVPNSGGVIFNDFIRPLGKLTGVLHSNQNDVWMLTHDSDSNIFKAWLATENGIDSIPVKSTIGSNISSLHINDSGQIKTSLQGDKIGVVYESLNQAEIFDFDPFTGLLSNLLILDSLNQPAGIEFSPSGQYLYITIIDGFDNSLNIDLSGILQFDLWAGNAQAIKNSMVKIPGFNAYRGAGDMQLANDGKIYITTSVDILTYSELGIINEPNLEGFNCHIGYSEAGGFDAVYKLPTFFHDIKLNELKIRNENNCEGSPTLFSLDNPNVIIDSLFWDFGDDASGVTNFSNIENPIHLYTSDGFYEINLEVYSGCKTYKREKRIYIGPESFNFREDTTVCAGKNIQLSVPHFFTSLNNIYNPNILWSDSSTNHFINTQDSGIHWIQFQINDCPLIIDTIIINHLSSPSVEFGDRGEICETKPMTILDATCQDCIYQWNDGSTDSTLTVSTTGFYTATVTLPNGCSDAAGIHFFTPTFEIIKQEQDLSCIGDSNGIVKALIDNPNFTPYSFLWENGDTIYFRDDLLAGIYGVTVSDGYGCTKDTVFNIEEPEKLAINYVVKPDDSNTSEVEGSVEFEVSGGRPPYIFDWEFFGEIDELLVKNLTKGIYPVTITDSGGCSEYVEIIVDELSTKEILEQIQIFPNPTNGILTLKINRRFFTDSKAIVYNSLGQEVLDFYIGKNQSEVLIDLSSFSTGMYLISIQFEDENKTWKIIRN